jgi:hypothetical protein
LTLQVEASERGFVSFPATRPAAAWPPALEARRDPSLWAQSLRKFPQNCQEKADVLWLGAFWIGFYVILPRRAEPDGFDKEMRWN